MAEITSRNPNKPAVIGGQTVTSDPLWIDGGTVNPSPTFNIDDPTMWIPMTVISGLASGYCERAAVISGGSVGGNIWPEGEADADVTSRRNLVSTLANNIAYGVSANASATNMFADRDPSFLAPVSGGWTYLRTFDKMLRHLTLTTGGYVKKANGSAYQSFDELKNSAAAYASNNGSALALNVSSNGVPLGSQGRIAWPKEWAIHRKWMLDELKYTSAPPESKTTFGDAAGVYKYVEDSLVYGNSRYCSTAQSAFSTLSAEFWSSSSTISDPRLYYGLTNSFGFYESYAIKDLIGTPLSVTLEHNQTLTGLRSGTTLGSSWTRLEDDRINGNVADRIIKSGATVYLETAKPLDGSVDVYMGQYSPIVSAIEINGQTTYTTSVVSTTVIAASTVSLYKVKSGGTLTVNSAVDVPNVIVYSSGTVHIENGGHVSCCTVLEGGILTGIKNIDIPNISSMFPDPLYSFGLTAGSRFTIVTGGTTTLNTAAALTSNSYYVSSTGVLVLSAPSTSNFEFPINGVQGEETIPRIIVDSGGKLIIRGTPDGDDVEGTGHMHINCPITVYPQGTLEVGMMSYMKPLDGNASNCCHLCGLPGSTLSFAAWWDPAGYNYGTWNLSWDCPALEISNAASLSYYSITNGADFDKLDRRYTGSAAIHVKNPAAVPTLYRIVGATYSLYGTATDTFDPCSGTKTIVTTHTGSSYTADTAYNWTLYTNVTQYIYDSLGISGVVEGKNTLTINSTTPSALLCVKTQGTTVSYNDSAALYTKDTVTGVWDRAPSVTDTSTWPAKLYTNIDKPQQGDVVYSSSNLNTSAARVYSVAYSLFTVIDPDIPNSPIDRSWLSRDFSCDVRYRCAIADIDIVQVTGGTPISNYPSFRIRQFYNDPDEQQANNN